jgi:hypothetical protein
MEDKAKELNLDAKLDTLDDHLQPIKEENVNNKADVEDVGGITDKSTDDDVSTEKDGQTDREVPVDEPDGQPESVDEVEGYTIDGDEEPEDTKPTEPEAKKSQLTPEQQYIIDNIKPISVRGLVGDSEKIETFEVLDPSQLPQGFKFIDDRDRALAVKAFSMLENQAERLQYDFRNQETTKAAQEFKQREDTADRADIGRLQREGELPKFKAEPGSKAFDSDPATVLIQEVIDFKESTNKRYTDEYNAGRPYKHIGFEEAFRLYKRENPVDTAQAKEDAEREKIAKRNSRSKGTAEQVKEKARVHSGSSSRDLDALIESLDW